MNIIVVNKEILQNRPPVLSTVLTLSDLGYDVSLISVGINEYWRKELDARGISYFIIPDSTRRNRISKIFEYLNFKRLTLRYLNRSILKGESILVWAIGGNTVFCLGKGIKRYQYVLQIQELHENDKSYSRVFSKVINEAGAVFVNEYNRAVIYQCKFKMNKRPVVLPNKPYYIDTESPYDLSAFVDTNVLNRIKHSKVLLFQGQIVSYRDMSSFIIAAKELGGYQIVLLGNEYGMVAKYKQIDENLVYIRRIPAPHYLGITALAHICLITYDPRSLNNSYCAPNKIYEYGAYGKPMIGNDIPGLQVIANNRAGILVDDKSVDSIKQALIQIEESYSEYSAGAKRLYNSVDNKITIAQTLADISVFPPNTIGTL